MTHADAGPTPAQAPIRATAALLDDVYSHQPRSASEAAYLICAALEAATGARASVSSSSDSGWQLLAGELLESADATTVHEHGNVRIAISTTPALMIEAKALDALSGWLGVHVERDRYRVEHLAMSEEVAVQSGVADEILAVRDLDQVLLSIVNRTLVLLDSDICGVLLRDGDVINMKACVGHRIIETAHLRMHRGQGLAGLVFQSGVHGQVDSYLTDRTISPDFIPLAEQEDTRSALAVPLLAHDQIIGVLEVWRRRDSNFTESDVRRMLGLAALATIAIENARLYDLQAVTVSRLSAAHEAMEHQVAQLARSARLQDALLRTVLEHPGAFERIMRTVADELGCTAVYARENGTIEASYPELTAQDAAVLPLEHTRSRSRSQEPLLCTLPDGRRMCTQAVIVGSQEIRTVSLIGSGEPDEALTAAASQVAMACELARLEQRAASQARNAAFEQVIWDLVEGPTEHRSAALSRAGELGLTLHGPHRILHGAFDNLVELARRNEWDTAALDAARRAVLRATKKCDRSGRIKLMSLRGDWIIGVISIESAAETRETMRSMMNAARDAVPGLRATWGVSSAYVDPMNFPAAHREAVAAMTGARRLQSGDCSLYDELGIVRLLVGGTGQNPDLQQFIDDVTGPLRDYDSRHDGSLVQTLRAFFDNDCSQRRAADALFIHPKTLSYRLTQIGELSGLDLATHADRVRADLALRMLQLSESHNSSEAPGQ